MKLTLTPNSTAMFSKNILILLMTEALAEMGASVSDRASYDDALKEDMIQFDLHTKEYDYVKQVTDFEQEKPRYIHTNSRNRAYNTSKPRGIKTQSYLRSHRKT